MAAALPSSPGLLSCLVLFQVPTSHGAFLAVAAVFLICSSGAGGGDSGLPGARLRFLRLLRAVCRGR